MKDFCVCVCVCVCEGGGGGGDIASFPGCVGGEKQSGIMFAHMSTPGNLGISVNHHHFHIP